MTTAEMSSVIPILSSSPPPLNDSLHDVDESFGDFDVASGISSCISCDDVDKQLSNSMKINVHCDTDADSSPGYDSIGFKFQSTCHNGETVGSHEDTDADHIPNDIIRSDDEDDDCGPAYCDKNNGDHRLSTRSESEHIPKADFTAKANDFSETEDLNHFPSDAKRLNPIDENVGVNKNFAQETFDHSDGKAWRDNCENPDDAINITNLPKEEPASENNNFKLKNLDNISNDNNFTSEGKCDDFGEFAADFDANSFGDDNNSEHLKSQNDANPGEVASGSKMETSKNEFGDFASNDDFGDFTADCSTKLQGNNECDCLENESSSEIMGNCGTETGDREFEARNNEFGNFTTKFENTEEGDDFGDFATNFDSNEQGDSAVGDFTLNKQDDDFAEFGGFEQSDVQQDEDWAADFQASEPMSASKVNIQLLVIVCTSGDSLQPASCKPLLSMLSVQL